ncbi:TPA: hypothetical protein KC497_005015 [Escherichia coli O146]|nr:hypothetical protein [Escherichia coli O146]HBC3229407.1 hypothetical protein [Escherichia coli O146]
MTLNRDARECLSALKQRPGKSGLKVHPEKTRQVRFGRFSMSHYRVEQGKSGTFTCTKIRGESELIIYPGIICSVIRLKTSRSALHGE